MKMIPGIVNINLPDCPYCNGKDVRVFNSMTGASYTRAGIILACWDCKEQFMQVIEFIKED